MLNVLENANFPDYNAWSIAFGWIILITFIVALACCAIGFKKFVYFLSIGYGFAVIGIAITNLIYFGITGGLEVMTAILNVLLILYGARLSGFLLVREIKSASYQKALADNTKTEKPMPIFVLVTIWLMCGALYVMQCAPVIYRSYNMMVFNAYYHVSGGGFSANLATYANTTFDWVATIIGAVVMTAGLALETISDLQKNKYKKENPKRWADRGLFKMCRCPNYFGEILFWTGVFFSGISIYKGAVQWIVSILGYILIVYVMISGAKRLEKRQLKNYGENPEFIEYTNTTPILIPLVPWYHMVKPEKKED